jgi:foldase protein PrsA
MAIRRLVSLGAAASLAAVALTAAVLPAFSASSAGAGPIRVATTPPAAHTASATPFSPHASGPVVATVNGEPITESEWMARLRLMAGKNALDNLVREKVIRQEARKNGVVVTPAEITKSATDLEGSYRKQFPSEARFEDFLKQQGLSLAGFQGAMRYTAEMRTIQQKLAEKLGEKVQVTDKELQDIYDKQKGQFVQQAEVKIAQIMLPYTGLDEAAQNKTKADATALMEKVKAPGADFAALAKQYSQDADTKDKGGELPWMSFSPYGPPFDQVVMAAPVGLIDQPVRSFKGYHIVKVIDKHPQRQRTFDEVKPELRKRVLEQRQSAQFREYMQQAEKTAKTDIKLKF